MRCQFFDKIGWYIPRDLRNKLKQEISDLKNLLEKEKEEIIRNNKIKELKEKKDNVKKIEFKFGKNKLVRIQREKIPKTYKKKFSEELVNTQANENIIMYYIDKKIKNVLTNKNNDTNFGNYEYLEILSEKIN